MQTTASEIGVEPLHVERSPVDRGRLSIWRWASGHHALHAGRAFDPGEVVHRFSALGRVESPTRHSVQVGEHEHILLDPAFLQYINHSCAPNVMLDVTNMEVVALRPIGEGTELQFFYPSTEWVMTHPFRCLCREVGCLGVIRGAAFLPAPFPSGIPLSPHIQALLAQSHAASAATRISTV